MCACNGGRDDVVVPQLPGWREPVWELELLDEPFRSRGSTPHAVVQVDDTALSLEGPRALQLDLLGSKILEQTTPLPEEHRDDVELELVEDAGGKCELGGSGAVNEHVLVARRLLGPGHRVRDVVHVGDQ